MRIKLSKSQWEEMGKKAGWMKTAAKYRVTDHPFNKQNYPDMIGKIVSNPPSFARVELVKDEVPCKYCGKLTRMTGTKLCNTCWAIEGYFQYPNEESDKAHVKRLTEQFNPKLVERIRQRVEQKKQGPVNH